MSTMEGGLIVGIGATALLDLWIIFQSKVFSVAPSNWCLLGRWAGYLSKGQFSHQGIAKTPAINGECIIGWVAHYATGVIFATTLFLVMGEEWVRQPTLLPALAFGVVTVVFPFLILQPGMGAGIAASGTPKPNQVRLRSLLNHFMFGVGLYVGASMLAALS